MARYKVATAKRNFQWPSTKNVGGTPGPQYPKDAFMEILQPIRSKSLNLVKGLVDGFYHTNKIYANFLKITAFSDLEGIYSSVFGRFPRYTAAICILTRAAADVTSANYLNALSDLESDLQKLKFLTVDATEVESPRDPRTPYDSDCRWLFHPAEPALAETAFLSVSKPLSGVI